MGMVSCSYVAAWTLFGMYQSYQRLMTQLGMPDKSIKVAIVHHANLKINSQREEFAEEGIQLSMPWLLSDFGTSAQPPI
jgi:hypothetical protein